MTHTAHARGKANEVRIIGGKWKGRKLRFQPAPDLRPTLARTRETLFNWLRPELAGARCLDLFAGSGVLGFEALSQGASFVGFVDSSRLAIRTLRTNIAALAASNSEVVCMDARRYLRSAPAAYDIVFVDPPYSRTALLRDTLQALRTGPVVPALVYVEHRDAALIESCALDQGWSIDRQTRAGETHGCLLLPIGCSEPDRPLTSPA